MKELSKYLGIEKSKSSRLHPEGDGMAEAFVKQTKSCIQKQVDLNGTNWDLFLQPTAFAIRSNVTNHTRLSPSELMLGSKLNQPVDFISPSPTTSFQHGQSKKFAETLRNRIKLCSETVNSNLRKSREIMKTSYDKNARRHNFKIGDKVMLWKPYKKSGIARCFQPNWDGPWVILENTGSTNCKVRKNNQELNVHFNQLKHCSTRDVSLDYVKTHTDTPLEVTFNDYLEDFYDDESGEIQETQPVNGQNEILDDTLPYNIVDDNEPRPADVIDQRWVSVDQRNILPGPRTRGVR